MSHQPDARPAQVVQHARHRAPLANLLGGGRLGQLPDDDISDGTAIADGDARELRHGAEVVVVELLVNRRVLIVETFIRLERDQHDGAGELTHEWREGGACRIRHHIDKEKIKVGGLHRRHERCRLLWIVGDTETMDVQATRRFRRNRPTGGRDALLRVRGRRGLRSSQHPHEGIFLLHHVIVESGALFPVRVESNAHYANVRRERLTAFDPLALRRQQNGRTGQHDNCHNVSHGNFTVFSLSNLSFGRE